MNLCDKYYTLLLIRKSARVKGMPQTVVLRRRAKLYEYMGKIDQALSESFKGRLLSDCDYDYDYFGKEVKRLKRKMKARQDEKQRVS